MAAKLAKKEKEKEKKQPNDGLADADNTQPPVNSLRQIIARLEGRSPTMDGGLDSEKNPPVTSHANQTGKPASPAYLVSTNSTAIKAVRVPLGIAPIDEAIDPSIPADFSQTDSSRGIVVNGLHEVRAETGIAAGASAGFALALGLTMATRTARKNLTHMGGNVHDQEGSKLPPVFWIADRYTRSEYGRFYGPGLAAFNLRPEDLIRIHPESREESLWAAGEIAATPGAAAFCLIEIRKHPKEMDLTTTRRLLLRAQVSRTPVILLRQSGEEEASAALTRWCVHPATSSHQADPALPLPDQFIGPPTFDVSLEKCRGGNANSQTRWTIEWNSDDQCLALASKNRTHRSVQPASHEERGGSAEILRLSGNGQQPGAERQSA